MKITPKPWTRFIKKLRGRIKRDNSWLNRQLPNKESSVEEEVVVAVDLKEAEGVVLDHRVDLLVVLMAGPQWVEDNHPLESTQSVKPLIHLDLNYLGKMWMRVYSLVLVEVRDGSLAGRGEAQAEEPEHLRKQSDHLMHLATGFQH